MIIYKYKIDIVNKWFKLKLPTGAKPLSFQTQKIDKPGYRGEDIVLWASHDDAVLDFMEYDYIALGTGIQMEMKGAEFIGTAQQYGCVWHLFWKPKGE